MLKKVCHACQTPRKKNKLSYTADLIAFCNASHECNDQHPNSPLNLVKHGKITQLTPHDEALKQLTLTTTHTTMKLLEPITFRLATIEQAQHIEERCKNLNVTTSEYIRILIESAIATTTPTPTTPTPTPTDDLTF